MRNTCLGYLTKGGAPEDQVRIYLIYLVYRISSIYIIFLSQDSDVTSDVSMQICKVFPAYGYLTKVGVPDEPDASLDLSVYMHMCAYLLVALYRYRYV